MVDAKGGMKMLSRLDVAKIERAAELLAIAKQARAGALAASPAYLVMVVRIENAAQRALEAAYASFESAPLAFNLARLKSPQAPRVEPKNTAEAPPPSRLIIEYVDGPETEISVVET
jgi:hypothetical protein